MVTTAKSHVGFFVEWKFDPTGFITNGFCCRDQKKILTTAVFFVSHEERRIQDIYSSPGGPFHSSLTVSTVHHNVNL